MKLEIRTGETMSTDKCKLNFDRLLVAQLAHEYILKGSFSFENYHTVSTLGSNSFGSILLP